VVLPEAVVALPASSQHLVAAAAPELAAQVEDDDSDIEIILSDEDWTLT
jgi:hypothetical protein